MQNKTISMDAAHDFYAKMPLARAIPLGLQHVFAMFVGNLTPLLIIKFALTILWLIGFEWVFALQARFENTVAGTLKNAFIGESPSEIAASSTLGLIW